jgi:hypothetical protein
MIGRIFTGAGSSVIAVAHERGEEMKYVKTAGLLAFASAALVALMGTGSASATVLCNNNTSTTACSSKIAAGTEIKSKLTGSAVLETTGGTTLDTCTGGEVNGKVENAGSSTTTVSGKNSAVTWSGCTVETKTLAPGSLEIHWVSGTDNGDVTGSGTEVTVNTGFFGACVYGPGIGKLLGRIVGAIKAVITITVTIPLTKNESGLCPSETKWTANYEVTTPSPLFVASG